MAVTRADKDAELQTLTTMFQGADAAIVLDYKGINVPQVTPLVMIALLIYARSAAKGGAA